MAENRAHALISGRVQGVSFRYFTYHEALKHGLSGWVRNTSDGTVEAVFQGERSAIEEVLEWCKMGPPAASVDQVEVQWEDASEVLDGFKVRPTASARGD